MPELPEMQALAERLGSLLKGRVLTRVTPLQFSAIKTFEPALESFAGNTLSETGRRGKFLILAFGGPRILIHLSQGGRVDVEDPAKTTRPKGAVARFVFRAAPSLLVKEFGTQRKAGVWTLGSADEGPLARLGPEPFSAEFTELVLTSQDGRRIHTLLRDQRTVAGIGRGYADDILHAARMSPYVSLKKLDSPARESLVRTTHAVLEAALEGERARTGGLPAKLGDRFTVHGRSGHPCPRCDGTLHRVSYDDYEIAYCPACQTGGKVLADRRMSRLIR